MKKFFIEPDIQKLRLNLRENIATSSGCSWPELGFITYPPRGTLHTIYNEDQMMAEYQKLKDAHDLVSLVPFLDKLGGCVIWFSQLNNDR